MSTANASAHGHPAHSHHFDSAEHEYQTGKQGVWLFLATEVLMFGGLFVGYAIFHHLYPEVFKIGAKFTDWRMGSANTVVLLTSSLTMALGIHFIQVGKQKAAFWNLVATVFCGAIFMTIKYFEYEHKISLGCEPGAWFHGNPDILAEHIGVSADAIPGNLALYFSFYYMMTGLHGLHVMFGMLAICWCIFRLKRGDFSEHNYAFVEGTGLFWHLIDLIWIYLFPLLYLVS